ncbi:prepilin peptidase [Candidatus Saccharibacteria bacterium]|nr:prepilin peptidase [Candidatus Saccharibacteria bacterium]
MQLLFLIMMFVFGAIMGSFLCCQARRLHQKFGSKSDQKSDSKTKSKTKKTTRTKSIQSRRSICLHCRHQLKWYENIPIISWLALRGKCKKCHHKIGLLELLSELGTALAFLLIGYKFLAGASVIGEATEGTNVFAINLFTDFPTITPMVWGIFAATILLTLALIFLAIYDGMCGELPVLGLTISAICAIILVSLQIGNNFLVSDSPSLLESILLPLASALLFGGIYLILYIMSKGQWVGDGDWIVAATIGLALGRPWLSLIALFLANFSACLVMLPAIKKQKDHHIYFGPFLVFAFIITFTFSNFLLELI